MHALLIATLLLSLVGCCSQHGPLGSHSRAQAVAKIIDDHLSIAVSAHLERDILTCADVERLIIPLLLRDNPGTNRGDWDGPTLFHGHFVIVSRRQPFAIVYVRRGTRDLRFFSAGRT